MDEFGVLVERYGVKVQGGKSTPMANLKAKTNSSNGFPSNLGFNSGKNSGYSSGDPFANDLDGIFRSNTSQNYDDNDVFGGVFANSKQQQNNVDIESGSGSTNKINYASTNANDDFDLFGTEPKRSDSIDDLFGNLGLKSDGLKKDPAGKRSESDDLIPGFGDFSSPSYSKKPDPRSPQQLNSSKSSFSSPDDPFLVFESSTSEANASSWPFSESSEHHPGINSVTSSIDELEDFANFKVRNDTTERPHLPKKDSSVKKPVDRAQEKSKNVRVTINKPNKATKPKSAAEDHMSAGFHKKGRPEEKKSSLSKKNVSPVKNFVDDLMFFGDSAPFSEAFQEVEDESEERRNARLKQHLKTQERMAKALAEKTRRDLQSQNEQEEKHRLADTLNYDIKRWATGKEGNLRALLSSLQHVLWPECGWQPVSLTDLITSTSVKKIYHKATLCVHPDKVQQKGATVRQKYIAEKVFDLLKEAWNKFNTEELR
ncbi:uncharacterized protein LOC129898670 [Solanum dulcamara]|uniref:uncharacterized protein LOC129898670 n=1 Tax=Solanum dulcamara TaxID=45834 RepID=UPI002485CFD5|nr:uncharacterized protein LOC129898670 [Solanum dulcamara]